jgi:hypothetical protein
MQISQLLRSMYHIVQEPNFNKDFLSEGQLSSKQWLIEKILDLDLNLGTAFICAGWYASLATLLFENRVKLERIRSFDIDESCAKIADTVNRPWVMDGWKFKASTLDILNMQYPTTYTTVRANGTTAELTEMPTTIINTSCEHIKEFDKWYEAIPFGTIVILQSNNYYEISDHVNCVSDLQEFELQAPMTTVLYSGEKQLSKYIRYMIIGIK